MFSFEITSVKNVYYGFVFTVTFSRNNQIIDTQTSGICFPYTSVFDWIQGKLNILQNVEDSDAQAQALVGATDLNSKPSPTDDDNVRAAISQLQSFKNTYIDTGILDATDPTYVGLQDAVKSLVPDGSVVITSPALPLPATKPPVN